MSEIEQSGGGRTYPREWFRVSPLGNIMSRTFIGETQHKLRYEQRGVVRLENKVSIYNTWYPTREEAEAKQSELAKRHNRPIVAAPELVEALRGLVSIQDIMDDEGVCDGDYVEPRIEAARALLARIDGEGA